METDTDNQRHPQHVQIHQELRGASAHGAPDSSVLMPPHVHWFKPLMLGLALFIVVFLGTVIAVDAYRARQKNEDPFALATAGTDGQSTVSNIQATNRSAIPKLETTDDPFLGPENAPVIVVLFADFQCPFCKEFFSTYREVAVQYQNRVKFIFRDMPLTDIHDRAQAAAEAAGCAFAQSNEKFWAFHDRLYQNQDDLTDAALLRAATQVGLDEKKFSACVASHERKAEVDEDYFDGAAAGVRGTPTLFFNGRRVQGVIPKEKFTKALDLLLQS